MLCAGGRQGTETQLPRWTERPLSLRPSACPGETWQVVWNKRENGLHLETKNLSSAPVQQSLVLSLWAVSPGRGATRVLRSSFCRSRAQRGHGRLTPTHALGSSGSEPGIYSRKMNQIVISRFCFSWITQQLSAGSRAARPQEGWREGGRKSQPLSQWGESVLKQALLTSYFHFLETTCATAGAHGYPGPRRGGKQEVAGDVFREMHLVTPVRHSGWGAEMSPCLRGRLLA